MESRRASFYPENDEKKFLDIWIKLERRSPSYMKKRTAVIGALVSLLPMGQPLVIGTGAALTSAAVMLAFPEKANAESAMFYFERALKKQNEGRDYYGAISDYNKAIEMQELSTYNLAAAYYNRGKAKSDIKDYKEALSDFNKAIDINPNKPDYYTFRGNTKSRLKADEYAAISDFNKAINLDLNNLLAYINRGISKERIGDIKGACSDWRKALAFGSKFSAKRIQKHC